MHSASMGSQWRLENMAGQSILIKEASEIHRGTKGVLRYGENTGALSSVVMVEMWVILGGKTTSEHREQRLIDSWAGVYLNTYYVAEKDLRC